MRLFYRLNETPNTPQAIESTHNELPLPSSKETITNEENSKHDEKQNICKLEPPPEIAFNEAPLKQDVSILSNIENKLPANNSIKNEDVDDNNELSSSLSASIIEPNNKENEHEDTSANHTTASQTFNTNNHNTSNANDNLTITAMVASIAKEKKMPVKPQAPVAPPVPQQQQQSHAQHTVMPVDLRREAKVNAVASQPWVMSNRLIQMLSMH